jgi:DNA mismatch repair protein MutL
MSIRILPAGLANKIAAGEVIERPASVVKELVENSIDAGAGRIEIELEDGGASLIRVVDDGRGMGADDLALAFASHATSKLTDEADLFSVRTMGFRGEALASVGAVSHARIVSRTAEADAGHEVEMRTGTIGPVRQCASPVGTCVEVRNLFANVPVRKRFLKTTATEMAHISEAVTRLALARPDRTFVLTHRGRSVFHLPASADRSERIGEFFGGEIADNLVPLAWRCPEFELEGYLLPPSVDRRNTRMQYVYVNGRYVRDRTLMHAIAEGYSGLITAGRRPVCFLFLSMDPGAVDVNVHPTKLEVRLRHASQVHQQLIAAMRDCLRGEKLTPRVALTGEPPPARQDEQIRQAISDFLSRPPSQGRDVASRGRGQRPASPGPQAVGAPVRPRVGDCLQVLDTYIIEESGDGISIIDQHALHERVLYNEIKARLQDGPLASQQLLVPDLVELPQQEFYAVMDLAEDLARFGTHVEAFGERTVIVRAFAQILGKFDARSFIEDLLSDLEGPDGARRTGGRLEKIIRLMACRGAVKAGQRLSAEQMRHLLEKRAALDSAETCPHGRPTTVRLTRAELEKQFRRT